MGRFSQLPYLICGILRISGAPKKGLAINEIWEIDVNQLGIQKGGYCLFFTASGTHADSDDLTGLCNVYG